MSCSKCNVDFQSREAVAKCVTCDLSFHPGCTSIGSAQNFTKAKNKTWKCDQCMGLPPASCSMNQDNSAILRAIASLKEDFNSNLDEKIGGVKSSIDQLTTELKSINNKVTVLEESQEELRARCDQLERDKQELAAGARELRLQLLDQEQHSRCANLEINGLPYTQGENVYAILDRLAVVLGVTGHVRGDISIAHRLRLYSKKHTAPPIIAQFVSRNTKESWLSATRKKGSISAREVLPLLPDVPIFVNHHLTTHNKALLGRARKLKKSKKISFAGYFNGKVLVRREEGEQSVRVMEMEDLDVYDK